MSLPTNKYRWNQDSTCDLIELYKKHTVLYETKNGDYKNKLKRLEALKAIRNEMIRRRGRKISIEDIKKKIHGLRTQYSNQLSKIRKSQQLDGEHGNSCKPSLWCFEHLDFLRHTDADNSDTQQDESTNHAPENNTIHECKDLGQFKVIKCFNDDTQEMGNSYDEVSIKQEECTPPATPVETPTFSATRVDKYDSFTAFGKLVEMELRQINRPDLLKKAKRDIFTILMDAQDNCT